ncbi:MAG TPA: hypothetical protein PKE69_27765 [Pyrinomonadaceae bacterium]|nr:hypothetical protein [Pyrinomonadaceae bacterium]
MQEQIPLLISFSGGKTSGLMTKLLLETFPFREIIWKANDEGKTIKYLHFNERTQRILIDYLFKEWASRVCGEMEEILRTKITK